MRTHNQAPDQDQLSPAYAAIAQNPVAPLGISEAEQRSALRGAQLDAAADRALNPKIVLKGDEAYRAAEYPNVFSFAELTDGPLTAVIVETPDEKILFRRESSPESETFHMLSTRQAEAQVKQGQTVAPVKVTRDALQEAIILPRMPVIIGGIGAESFASKGKASRVTGLELDEPIVMSDGMAKRLAHHVTDARETFNQDIRHIREFGVASRTGGITSQAVTSTGIRIRGPRTVDEMEQRINERVAKDRAEREKKRREEVQTAGLTNLSHTLVNRLISPEGPQPQAHIKDGKMRWAQYNGIFTGPKSNSDPRGGTRDMLSTYVIVSNEKSGETRYHVGGLGTWTSHIDPETHELVFNYTNLHGAYNTDKTDARDLAAAYKVLQEKLDTYRLT